MGRGGRGEEGREGGGEWRRREGRGRVREGEGRSGGDTVRSLVWSTHCSGESS